MSQCRLCGGDVGVLGKLGTTTVKACRNCGMQYLREETWQERDRRQAKERRESEKKARLEK